VSAIWAIIVGTLTRMVARWRATSSKRRSGVGLVGEQHRGAPEVEREEEVAPGGVAEEELRHRQRHVGLRHLQHVPRVALGVVDEVVGPVHGGLGGAGEPLE
jgi:hypothetical protein